VYTIDDPAENALVLGAGALAAGCTPFDSDTVRCPAAPSAALNVFTRDQSDSIVLATVPVPATIDGGSFDDVIVGTAADAVILWAPGGNSDTIDGGPGEDTLAFAGANVSETITVTANGAGFDLTRDVASVHLSVRGVEVLDVNTFGGPDAVSTMALVGTSQTFTDATDDLGDVLTLDVQGLCAEGVYGDIELLGHGGVAFSGFPLFDVLNERCGGRIGLANGVLRYVDVERVPNDLRVARMPTATRSPIRPRTT
jgi:hypothetical protein